MRNIITLFLFTFSFLLSSCVPKLNIPDPSPGNANFSKTIAIGGDFMAGYQDDALYMKGQQYCIPALLAEQFKLVGGTMFNQALMPDNNGLGLNSKPWESWFVTPSHLGYRTDCAGVTSLFPNKNTISVSSATPYLVGIAGNTVQNMAVPFANTIDYFNPAFGTAFSPTANKNPYYNRFASLPGVSTICADAKAQKASFVTAWLGMEDIFNYASSGGTSAPIPSAAVFSNYLDTLLGGLTANGAKGVIANIPDFRSFPYYTLIAWNNADLKQSQVDSLNDIYTSSGLTQISFHVGTNGFIIADSTVSNGYVRQMHKGEYITLSVPVDSMKCTKYGLLVNLINDRYALDSTEVYAIDQATNSYNAVITQKAAQYNLALVDMNSFFKTVNSGIKWNGVDFNAQFITGGFFSLDGYHPNQKGYAIIANEFIKAINTKYNAYIPSVYCTECDGIIFP
ncbi:MAG: SGNH/GDSL hydrolase family protein [Bacteroidia bacterium]